jgi:hypothetical protein
MNDAAPLLHVCSLLNQHRARYLVVGARACWLHGYIRATMDVDILVPEDLETMLGLLPPFPPLRTTLQDFVDNVVVKIADEVEVDVSTRAWKVRYADAVGTSLKTTIQDVEIPYLDLRTLIATKRTHRGQDQVDIQQLLSLGK